MENLRRMRKYSLHQVLESFSEELVLITSILK